MVGICVEGNNKSGVAEFKGVGSRGGLDELVEVEEEEREPVECVASYSISVR